MLPAAANPFFQAEFCVDGAELPAAFAVLVVISGDGELKSEHGTVQLRTGSTVLIPYGAGPTSLHGSVQAVRCLPPD
jgi:mannose-6-phosphate isomerase